MHSGCIIPAAWETPVNGSACPFLSRRASKKAVTWSGLRQSFANAIQNVQDHHTIQVSADLAFYFFLALFPVLTLLSVLLSWFPIPGLFNDAVPEGCQGHLVKVCKKLLRIWFHVPTRLTVCGASSNLQLHREGGGRMTSSECGSSCGSRRPGEVAAT